MTKVVPQVDPLGTVAEHEIADIEISRKPWFNVSIAASLPMRHQDISLKLGDALVFDWASSFKDLTRSWSSGLREK